MARKKKPAATKEAAEEKAREAASVVEQRPEARAERPAAPVVAAEQPDGRPERSSAADKATGETDRFRSWVTDRGAGYERFVDDKAQLLVLRFAEKPADDALAKLKAAGFRYQPEYFGQQKVWTRRNDFEGRLRLEEIEKQVRGPAAEPIPF